jgi:hypothetical protein
VEVGVLAAAAVGPGTGTTQEALDSPSKACQRRSLEEPGMLEQASRRSSELTSEVDMARGRGEGPGVGCRRRFVGGEVGGWLG